MSTLAETGEVGILDRRRASDSTLMTFLWGSYKEHRMGYYNDQGTRVAQRPAMEEEE